MAQLLLLSLATIFLSACAEKIAPVAVCPPITVPADARKTNKGDFPPLPIPAKDADGTYHMSQTWVDNAATEIQVLKQALIELVAGVDAYNGAYAPKKESGK